MARKDEKSRGATADSSGKGTSACGTRSGSGKFYAGESNGSVHTITYKLQIFEYRGIEIEGLFRQHLQKMRRL